MATIPRSGRYIQQPGGYRAFIPKPLPPDPPIDLGGDLAQLLSNADRALGRLDGVASVLPNPNLFVAMYVRQEAVLSSQIEGTQSTLQDLLDFEAGGRRASQPRDVEEVVNYVRAMNHGLARITELPLSLRLTREIHSELLEGVRGQNRSPGEFRRTQNWLGPQGCTLREAEFVPPPPQEMNQALHDFERFLHARDSLPVLVQCGLAHAQFETIHPFLDGNGRVGRLLITLLLCERGVLQRPLLYLSHYLRAHRAEYYDRLTAIRNDGDWEGWLKFFLRGVYEISRSATESSRSILELRERHRDQIASLSSSNSGLRLLDYLFQQPVVTIRLVADQLGCSFVTAARTVEDMGRLGLLVEVTGWKRNRRYSYDPYLQLFDQRGLADR